MEMLESVPGRSIRAQGLLDNSEQISQKPGTVVEGQHLQGLSGVLLMYAFHSCSPFPIMVLHDAEVIGTHYAPSRSQ